MAKTEESVDSILKAIREAIVDKEQQSRTHFLSEKKAKKEPVAEEDEVFELTKNMIVKREDIPYQLGVWSFDDVAKKIMKKYRTYFARRTVKADMPNSNDNHDDRVCVKENSLA